MARLYGVDRSQPITPITSTAGHNIFENSMRERMTTIERRDPIQAPAEGNNQSYTTFGDYHQRSSHKDRQHSPPGKHNGSRSGSKPNHPLMTASKGSSKPHPPTNHVVPSKHIKKHKKGRHGHTREDTTHESPAAHTLGSIGKSSSFTTGSSVGRTSPTLSERGASHSKVQVLRRSNSADTPVENPPLPPSFDQPTHTGKTGHTSFSCYNASPSSEKRKDKKVKKIKKEEMFDTNSYSTGDRASQVLDHVTLTDSKSLSKPCKLK